MMRLYAALKYSLVIALLFLLLFNVACAQTWVPKNVGQYSGNMSTMVFFNDTLYAGTQDDGIYFSTNRGQSWGQMDQGLPEEADISSFAIHNDTLFAGLFFGGVYFKTTKSRKWNLISSTPYQVTALDFIGDELYAGSVNGVYVSATNSRIAPLQSQNSGFPTGSNGYNWINAMCHAGSSILAGGYQGTYLLQSNGTWAADLTGMGSQTAINVLENIQDEIYCGTLSGKLYVSEDNGATWLSISGALPTFDFSINSVSVYQSQLLVGMGSGKLISSTNKGASWNTLFVAPSAITDILVDGTDIFAATYGDGVYKSNDGGASWSKASAGIVNAPVGQIKNIDGSLYAASNDNLYRSDNSGKTWSTIMNTAGTNGVNQFHFALVGDSLITLSNFNYGISFSIDKGNTWQPFPSVGLTSGDYFISLYSYSDELFAGSESGVYKFDKANRVWHSLGQFPSISSINCFLQRGDSLLAGGWNDIFLSLDHGATWAPINSNAPTNFLSWNMVDVKGKLYASSNDGLYFSENNGTSWTKVDTQKWGSVNSIFGYKNYLFVGTYYNGIFFSSDGADTWKSSPNGFPYPLTVSAFTVLNDTIYAGTTEGAWACAIKDFGPSISSMTPSSGQPGTIVSIYGANFDSEVAYDSVYFNGSAARILVASDNGISVVVPAKAKTGPVKIKILGGGIVTSSNDFIVLQNQRILFPTIANVTLGDPAFTLSATDSSGLAIIYTSSLGRVTISGDVITPSTAGRDTITASQPGNAFYIAAKSVKQSFCINPPQPTIGFSANAATATLTSSATTGNQWFLNGSPIAGANSSTYDASESGVYAVQSKVDDCVSTLSADKTIVITGEIVSYNVEPILYPNPSKDYICVSGIQTNEPHLSVIDIMGQGTTINLMQQGDTFVGDVKTLASGMYLVKFGSNSTMRPIKFIKQ